MSKDKKPNIELAKILLDVAKGTGNSFPLSSQKKTLERLEETKRARNDTSERNKVGGLNRLEVYARWLINKNTTPRYLKGVIDEITALEMNLVRKEDGESEITPYAIRNIRVAWDNVSKKSEAQVAAYAEKNPEKFTAQKDFVEKIRAEREAKNKKNKKWKL